MATTFTQRFSVGNPEDYKRALEELYSKISSVKKDISYLDIYNITQVCVDKNKFASQMNTLTPNSSLVINTEGFQYNNEYYETGDIMLKLASGQVIHVKAQTGGVFVPKSVKENGDNLTLTYEFSTEIPQDGTTTSIQLSTTDGAGVYSYWGLASGSFDQKFDTSGKVITPYIKFYFVNDNNQSVEEAVVTYTLVPNNTNKTYRVQFSHPVDSKLFMLVK